MRAIVQRAYGSAGTLSLQTVACPAISDTEVLVEVHAAGVDRGTWHLMTGMPYLVRLAGFGLTKPNRLNPGFDVAGRVAAVGSAVTRFAVGDEVFGIARASYAEYAAASQDKLVLKPRQATFEQAAVSTVSGITALQALMDVGKLRPGQSVLVIGASGGVGTFAVQIAKVLGAHVTGVASTAKLDMVRALGAEHVIDYTRDDFATGDSRYDLIIDTGGRNSLGRLRRVLSERGTLVIVGGEGGDRLTGGIGLQLRAKLLSPFVKQRLTTFISKEQRSSIEKLAELIASGEVVPAIGQRFPLEDTAQAIRRLEAGQASGKSVIVVRDQSAEAAH
ncbi:MAG: NAD(P)-dependent alcohol dehydrogenase [Dehalococcoidia bacterium]|nr:NAD(P)-dependent alcohol dehydrogenase [Dehalococcoidia bacterium]MCB9485767.1 NAD(P)-dependent alcohol dehydrogenase [Thermoflexaceae bacterium]